VSTAEGGAGPATERPSGAGPFAPGGVYARLGVRRVINAYETLSILGGTRMHPEVWAAMDAAREAFVDLRELHAAVGRRLAELTRNEAAVVTGGASAGMLLAAVACAAARDPGFLLQLTAPPTPGPRPRIVVQRVHMSPYVQNVRQANVDLVEVGYTQNTTPETHLEAALVPPTVAVLYTAGRPYEREGIPLERVVAMAHARGIPVIVDAAALVPPAANLWRFTERGADLAVFSGGKGLQGPQDAGLVVGRADLVATILSVIAPIHGVGRSLKLAKEGVIGMLTAVELAVRADEGARYATLLRRVERVTAGLRHVGWLDVAIVPDGRQGQPCPRAVLRLQPEAPLRRPELLARLQGGDPSIVLGPFEDDPDAVYVHPLGLTDAEADEVVAAVRAAGSAAPTGV
jgi:D-glucosaminate-6-phosphate ammonia-lyase